MNNARLFDPKQTQLLPKIAKQTFQSTLRIFPNYTIVSIDKPFHSHTHTYVHKSTLNPLNRRNTTPTLKSRVHTIHACLSPLSRRQGQVHRVRGGRNGGVGSSAFLCSCSKSGGGSRGGQAVKLAGRNHDMKRRCGIATSWPTSTRYTKLCRSTVHGRETRSPPGGRSDLSAVDGCTEAGLHGDGSRRRGTRVEAPVSLYSSMGRQLQDGNAQALGVSAWRR